MMNILVVFFFAFNLLISISPCDGKRGSQAKQIQNEATSHIRGRKMEIKKGSNLFYNKFLRSVALEDDDRHDQDPSDLDYYIPKSSYPTSTPTGQSSPSNSLTNSVLDISLNEDGGGSNTGLFAGVAVGMGIGAIAVGLMIRRVRNLKKDDRNDEDSNSADYEEEL